MAAPPPAPAAEPTLQVGVARADITPPTGYFSFGYVRADGLIEGALSRLWARVIVLERSGEKLALVAADLGDIPGGMLEHAIYQGTPVSPSLRSLRARAERCARGRAGGRGQRPSRSAARLSRRGGPGGHRRSAPDVDADLSYRPDRARKGVVRFLVDGEPVKVRNPSAGRFEVEAPPGARVEVPAGAARPLRQPQRGGSGAAGLIAGRQRCWRAGPSAEQQRCCWAGRVSSGLDPATTIDVHSTGAPGFDMVVPCV